jgi:hypothetical protein
MPLGAPFPVNSAHTKYMREDKVPLCDRHHLRMRPEQASFLPNIVFKCASQGCRRYHGRQYVVFGLADLCHHPQNKLTPQVAA